VATQRYDTIISSSHGRHTDNDPRICFLQVALALSQPSRDDYPLPPFTATDEQHLVQFLAENTVGARGRKGSIKLYSKLKIEVR
jgi:hypothetical protein